MERIPSIIISIDPRRFDLDDEVRIFISDQCHVGILFSEWRVIGTVGAGDAAVLVDGRPRAGTTGWQSFD